MKVVLSSEAQADLLRLGDFIAADNPVRARTFVRELRESARQLGDMPRAFPLVPRHEREGVRRRRHGDYLIFYRIGVDRIDVLHILHGAQDYEVLLFPIEPDTGA